MTSTYCEAVSGLSPTNRALLAQIAVLQHESRLPIIAGGDFNMLPKVLLTSDFLVRSNLRVAAPQRATCVTKQASRVIDYYLMSRRWSTLSRTAPQFSTSCARIGPYAYSSP